MPKYLPLLLVVSFLLVAAYVGPLWGLVCLLIAGLVGTGVALKRAADKLNSGDF